MTVRAFRSDGGLVGACTTVPTTFTVTDVNTTAASITFGTAQKYQSYVEVPLIIPYSQGAGSFTFAASANAHGPRAWA